MVKVSEIVSAMETLAPLGLQEAYDNSGLQTGRRDKELGRVLVALDLTEEVIGEAAAKGCGMIVTHHPLLFHPLKRICDLTFQQRCVAEAIRQDIAIYSAHTSLDNAPGGVNARIASVIGLSGCRWIEQRPGGEGGSGIIGRLGSEMDTGEFLDMLKEKFSVKYISHSKSSIGTISTVAVCGGSGAFLASAAESLGADCFVTGEISYHSWFDAGRMMMVSLGHYQSEACAVGLIVEHLAASFGDRLEVLGTSIDTNPIEYC